MRWKVEAKPKHGEIRHVAKFAWWPTLVSDHKIWLENYVSVQEHQRIWNCRSETYGCFWSEIERKLVDEAIDDLHQ